MPPRHIRHAIVAVLRALDDKIELNRKMNRTLEEMAQTCIFECYRDADPTESRPANGWILRLLGEICATAGGDIQTGPFGTQLHAADYVPIGVPSVMPKDLKDDRISEEGVARIREEDARRLMMYRLEEGDIVVSRRGDVERRALVTQRERGWLCGTGCLRIRAGGTHEDCIFLYYYLGHPTVRAWIVRHAQGATMPNLNTRILGSLPVLLPPPAIRARVCSLLEPMHMRREANFDESATLAQLRDTLLPKLISGEIRVPEAERTVEAAV
jgi:type I restriction enzyme S subunit